ncbi:helicase HerA-like domain-containing protein [Agrococcus casei]|uniref:ATPase component BioM of energizing module of biotin ECF transporter n=1 Tax=Agrococcus casei LMG 22410 TaxID=1255656 RepID=A0A1R4GG63_9MICO|nr:helicase HerA-like domain-containing protein [Agrococcus casei]SJM67227.1 ATPase component BioM of energizing module of biotin ECF transporter [Agrococcus casei LMG 22410]
MSDSQIEQAKKALEEAQRALAEAEAKAAEAANAEEAADAPVDEPAAAPAEPAAGGPLSEPSVSVIRDGYKSEASSLDIGALVNGEARADVQVRIPLRMLNRHGLVAGATGTGKTKTLQVLAEQLSDAGVPVFAPDIKGDLTGVLTAGESGEKLLARTEGIGQAWEGKAFPSELFSLGGRGTGVPIRATVTDFGPLLLSKVLGLNQTQESSLSLVFAFADQQGLPLVDLKDLREVLLYLTGDEGKEELGRIGGVSKATVGVILRELTAFAADGAEVFFGEPEFEIDDLLQVTDGRGVISLLQIPEVASQPRLFSTFLMWLLGELFELLPEVGDPDKPKLVFFFDEAHLLFNDASKDFLAAITQTVRLIRSKGVGVFFVTQTPKDVPGDVLAQLGSRIQHQLRAHTPDSAKALRQTVRTYPNSDYDLEEVLTQLGIGEAIVTVMNEKGAPTPVAWTRVRAPQGSMDPSPQATQDAVVQASSLDAKYRDAVDRESAFEMLQARIGAAEAAAEAEAFAKEEEERREAELKEAARLEREAARDAKAKSSSRSKRDNGNPVLDALTSRTGQRIIKQVFRGILGNRRR